MQSAGMGGFSQNDEFKIFTHSCVIGKQYKYLSWALPMTHLCLKSVIDRQCHVVVNPSIVVCMHGCKQTTQEGSQHNITAPQRNARKLQKRVQCGTTIVWIMLTRLSVQSIYPSTSGINSIINSSYHKMTPVSLPNQIIIKIPTNNRARNSGACIICTSYHFESKEKVEIFDFFNYKSSLSDIARFTRRHRPRGGFRIYQKLHR